MKVELLTQFTVYLSIDLYINSQVRTASFVSDKHTDHPTPTDHSERCTPVAIESCVHVHSMKLMSSMGQHSPDWLTTIQIAILTAQTHHTPGIG